MGTAAFFAVIALIAWGIGDVFGAVASRRVGAYPTAFWLAVLSIPVMLPFIPGQIGRLELWTLPLFLLTVALGLVLYGGLLAFYVAFREDNASIVGVISAAFPLVVAVLSVMFLGERLTGLQTGIISVTVFGVLLSGLKQLPGKGRGLVTSRGVVLALTAMMLWGVYITFLKVVIDAVGWFWPGVVVSVTGMVLLTIVMKLRGESFTLPRSRSLLWPLVGNALLLNIGGFANNAALLHGTASLVAPISGAYPMLFVIGAYVVFKESLRPFQILGVLIALIGVISLALVS